MSNDDIIVKLPPLALRVPAQAAALVLAAIDRRAIALVRAFVYIFPVFIRHGVGAYYGQFGVLWIAALLGSAERLGVTTRV